MFYAPLRDIQQSYSTPYFSQFSDAQTSLALWLQDLLKTKVGQNDMSEKKNETCNIIVGYTLLTEGWLLFETFSTRFESSCPV